MKWKLLIDLLEFFIVIIHENPQYVPIDGNLKMYLENCQGLCQFRVAEIYHMNPAKIDTASFRKITGLLPKSIGWYGAYLFKAFPLNNGTVTVFKV